MECRELVERCEEGRKALEGMLSLSSGLDQMRACSLSSTCTAQSAATPGPPPPPAPAAPSAPVSAAPTTIAEEGDHTSRAASTSAPLLSPHGSLVSPPLVMACAPQQQQQQHKQHSAPASTTPAGSRGRETRVGRPVHTKDVSPPPTATRRSALAQLNGGHQNFWSNAPPLPIVGKPMTSVLSLFKGRTQTQTQPPPQQQQLAQAQPTTEAQQRMTIASTRTLDSPCVLEKENFYSGAVANVPDRVDHGFCHLLPGGGAPSSSRTLSLTPVRGYRAGAAYAAVSSPELPPPPVPSCMTPTTVGGFPYLPEHPASPASTKVPSPGLSSLRHDLLASPLSCVGGPGAAAAPGYPVSPPSLRRRELGLLSPTANPAPIPSSKAPGGGGGGNAPSLARRPAASAQRASLLLASMAPSPATYAASSQRDVSPVRERRTPARVGRPTQQILVASVVASAEVSPRRRAGGGVGGGGDVALRPSPRRQPRPADTDRNVSPRRIRPELPVSSPVALSPRVAAAPAWGGKSLELLLYEGVKKQVRAESRHEMLAVKQKAADVCLQLTQRSLLEQHYRLWLRWVEFSAHADYFIPDEGAVVAARPDAVTQTDDDGVSSAGRSASAAASASSPPVGSRSPRMRLRNLFANDMSASLLAISASAAAMRTYEAMGAYQSGDQWFFLPSQMAGGVLTCDIHLQIPHLPDRAPDAQSTTTEPLDEPSSLRSTLETLDLPMTPISEVMRTTQSAAGTPHETPHETPRVSPRETPREDVPMQPTSVPNNTPMLPGLMVDGNEPADGPSGARKNLAPRSPRQQKLLSPKMRPPESHLESRPEQQPGHLMAGAQGQPLGHLTSSRNTDDTDDSKPDQAMLESLNRSCMSIAGAVATTHAAKVPTASPFGDRTPSAFTQKLVESISARNEPRLEQSQGAFSILDLDRSQSSDDKSPRSGESPLGVNTPKSGPCRHLPARQRRNTNTKRLGDHSHPPDHALERISPRVPSATSSLRSTMSNKDGPMVLSLNKGPRRAASHERSPADAAGSGENNLVYAIGDSLELDPSDRGGHPLRAPKKALVCTTSPSDMKGGRPATVAAATAAAGLLASQQQQQQQQQQHRLHPTQLSTLPPQTQEGLPRETLLRKQAAPMTLASPPRRRTAWDGGLLDSALSGLISLGSTSSQCVEDGGGGVGGSGSGGLAASAAAAAAAASTKTLEHRVSPARTRNSVRSFSPRRTNPGAMRAARELSPLSDLEDEVLMPRGSLPYSVKSREASPLRSRHASPSPGLVHLSVPSSVMSELERLRAENAALRLSSQAALSQHASPAPRRTSPPQAILQTHYDRNPNASPRRTAPVVLVPVTNPRDFRAEKSGGVGGVPPRQHTPSYHESPPRQPMFSIPAQARSLFHTR